jgi:ribose/xylose/arabinose/galactoside ABC-type transport system permease subunit
MIARFKSWEGVLLALLVIIFAFNTWATPEFASVGNQINLFQLSIEKIIMALVMTFVIINAEIDLSIGSMMGCSCKGCRPVCASRSVWGSGWQVGRSTVSSSPASAFLRWWSPWPR